MPRRVVLPGGAVPKLSLTSGANCIRLHGKRDVQVTWLDKNAEWEAVGAVVEDQQLFRMRVPLASFRGELDPLRPMRINVEVTFLSGDKIKQVIKKWAPPSGDNLMSRLGYGNADPREMGWLVRE